MRKQRVVSGSNSAIKKILIANRGEISIRIARTCKRMGIRTVGIYSELDRHSLHLDFCDEVYSLGEGSISDTYLNADKIIEIVKKTTSDAVHPGYGFLSERAHFAESVAAAGAVFIGPDPQSIKSMGDKIEAKRLMEKMGVPLLPGTKAGVKDFSEAEREALRIGFPVLLKASAGGGGKGMRIVRKKEELKSALEASSREAKNYFGDGTVYIEKFLENPHHVEVQVLGDGFGGGGHVFDRECSIQRRHQKLVEESPSPLLMKHPATKQKMLDVATSVVSQMKYASAGTLEFLADDDGGFYFLEMNTRLQVEHPVTEWVTGMDLVENQIRVASGERFPSGDFGSELSLEQRGHAIEVRIYAETPFEYMPCAGKVAGLHLPSGPFVRVDSSIYTGYDVLTDYDPTLMKLSVWGATRAEAVARMRSSIDELRILGVGCNQGLFHAITREENFIEGEYGTPYLGLHRDKLKKIYDDELKRILPMLSSGAVSVIERGGIASNNQTGSTNGSSGVWQELSRRNAIRGNL